MTWNCRIGGFRKKAKHVAPFRPDVLAVQEVEPIDSVLMFAGESQPTYRHRLGDPAYPRRAIGMFSYTDTKLTPVDEDDPMYCFRRYEARHGDLVFHVVGVWTAGTKSKLTSYRQAHEGIVRHEAWIREGPTVLLGDFNNNATWGRVWQDLESLTTSVGLVSAYHQFFSEKFGAETRSTYFHLGKESAPFHLDYCFLPNEWMKHVTNVKVGKYANWRGISDHAPIVVDLAL